MYISPTAPCRTGTQAEHAKVFFSFLIVNNTIKNICYQKRKFTRTKRKNKQNFIYWQNERKKRHFSAVVVRCYCLSVYCWEWSVSARVCAFRITCTIDVSTHFSVLYILFIKYLYTRCAYISRCEPANVYKVRECVFVFVLSFFLFSLAHLFIASFSSSLLKHIHFYYHWTHKNNNYLNN